VSAAGNLWGHSLTLAHLGVLFLDELSLYRRPASISWEFKDLNGPFYAAAASTARWGELRVG
jgi:hypothetical protein